MLFATILMSVLYNSIFGLPLNILLLPAFSSFQSLGSVLFHTWSISLNDVHLVFLYLFFLYDHLFCFLNSTYEGNHIVFVFLWLTILLSIMLSSSIHVITNGKISFILDSTGYHTTVENTLMDTRGEVGGWGNGCNRWRGLRSTLVMSTGCYI